MHDAGRRRGDELKRPPGVGGQGGRQRQRIRGCRLSQGRSRDGRDGPRNI